MNSITKLLLLTAALIAALWLLCLPLRAESYHVEDPPKMWVPSAIGSAQDDYFFWAGKTTGQPGQSVWWNFKWAIPASLSGLAPCDGRIHVAGMGKQPFQIWVRSSTSLPWVVATNQPGRYAVDFPVYAYPATVDLYLGGPSVPTLCLLDKIELGYPDVPPSPLNPPDTADLVIVFPRAFQRPVERLCGIRRAAGLAVYAVALEDIQAAYGAGAGAIKAFLADFDQPPASLLLAGNGTLNVENHPDYRRCLIPPVPSRKFDATPFGTLTTYGLDMPYGDRDGDGLPETAVGRIPAEVPSELETAIDKIVAFETSAASKALIFSATGAGDVAASVATNYSGETTLLRQENYKTPAAFKAAILGAINTGEYRLVAYMGHGNECAWGDQVFFKAGDVAALTNPVPVLLIGAACYATSFASPDRAFCSIAIDALRKPDGGAVAAWGGAMETTMPAAATAVSRILACTGTLGEAALQIAADKHKTVAPWTADADVLLGDPTMRIGGAR